MEIVDAFDIDTIHKPDLRISSPLTKFTKSASNYNYVLGSGEFRSLLITFANSLDPDQDRHIVGSDLVSNRLTDW